MIFQIFSLIIMTMSGPIQAIALENMLEGSDRTTRWFRITCWTILAFLLSSINVLISGGETTVLIRNGINIVYTIWVIFFFYKGPLWKRVTALMMVTFAFILGEMVFVIAMQLEFVNKEVLMQGIYDKSNLFSVLAVSVNTMISAIAIFIVVIVWKKVAHKGSSVKNYLFFLLYILNHWVAVLLMEWTLWEGKFSVILGWSMMTNLICEIILVVIIFGQSEKESIESALLKEQQRAQLEKMHYTNIEKHRTELLRLSVDNKQKISKVCNWLEKNEVEKAEKFLFDWSEKISMTKEYPYCGIPVINVLISEKKKVCDEVGITMEIDLQISEESNIEQMDLCSIIGNLLDNAIRAGKQIVENKDSKFEAKIEIVAGCAGDYLVIKCKNTVSKAPGVKPEGTGLGHKILMDIANRYQGDFYTKYEEHSFLAQMSLKIR